jgi:DNA-binding Lrp family transcriptional regulator
MNVDNLDKKLVQYLSRGTYSYEDLARECNVTRNTVYRRIAALEKQGVIQNIIRCSINYDKLSLVTLCISAKIMQIDRQRAYAGLKANPYVKLLWRSFGDHSNMLMIVFCPKGNEGEVIEELTEILEKFNATNIQTTVGFAWEKMDLSPFVEEPETGLLDQLIVSPPKG